jgi:hypothetical protein
MTTDRPRIHDSVDSMVDETLERVGRRVILGTPLGLGKANQIANAFYRRAAADPSIDLTIYTALTLAPPRWSSELERRLVEPMNERLFGGYPELDWVDAMRPSGETSLPENVEVREFYFRPGSMLGSPRAQRSYISANYSHVVRDLLHEGMNVLAQTVSAEEVPGPDGSPDGSREMYSLSCNSDLTVDLLPALRAREEAGEPVAVLAQVNRKLPFFYGDAMVEPAAFHGVIDRPELEFPLFGAPDLPIDTVDYSIALHVSALIRDGGTLQIGIGSLGDAIVRMLQMRHEDGGTYGRVLDDFEIPARHGELIEAWGGTGPFERGLYGASEMLVDGFLELYRSGILKRRVYPDAELQRRIDENPELEASLGDRLQGGRLAHACFFLGPKSFYQALRDMPRAERELFEMTGISFVNELYGPPSRGEELKRAQRRHARFVNTGMIATLLGAVASDGLEDGRVVSGVGGQYNFVAMAQALDDGRSILMIRSVRESGGETVSNLRFSYGHTTIPRHLRDVVVTEYGIADVRGKSDEEVVAAMLSVADSRFQEGLLEEAKRAGKIARDYEIPDRFRENTPERLEATLAPYRERGLFEELPFGTDLTEVELTLTRALRGMQRKIEGRDLSLLPDLDGVKKIVSVPDEARPYLERMGLAEPEGVKERLMQRAVVFALVEGGYL